MESTTGGFATVPELNPDVQQLIRSEQERRYRSFGLSLGLGADPQKAYERLTGAPLSADFHSPYEDPKRYQIINVILGSIQRAIQSSGASAIDPQPVFASLPSGDVNAQVSLEPKDWCGHGSAASS